MLFVFCLYCDVLQLLILLPQQSDFMSLSVHMRDMEIVETVASFKAIIM